MGRPVRKFGNLMGFLDEGGEMYALFSPRTGRNPIAQGSECRERTLENDDERYLCD